MTFGGDIRTTLIQEFWSQSHLTIVVFDTMFFSNRDVREEFAIDEHYVGPAHNWPAPSFCVIVDCHEGYMVFVRAGDEEHPKPIWLVEVLSSLNFVRTSPNFHHIEVDYCHPSTKDHNILCSYLSWDIKKSFKWTMDSTYGPV